MEKGDDDEGAHSRRDCGRQAALGKLSGRRPWGGGVTSSVGTLCRISKVSTPWRA